MSAPPRSYLFVPANATARVTNALASEADAIVLDLEDSVAEPHKQRAREAAARAREAAERARKPGRERELWVRINAVGSSAWRDDLGAVVGPGLAGLRVPKLGRDGSSSEALAQLDTALAQLEHQRGLAPGACRLICTIECGAGLLDARQIAEHPRVVRLAFGAADFAADSQSFIDSQAPLADWARCQIAVASAAAGLPGAIESPHVEVHDFAGLEASSRRARALGLTARSALHPRQLATIHQIFSPTRAELEWARQVVRAFELAGGQSGGICLDSQFIGPPALARARFILAAARPHLTTAEICSLTEDHG
ncbi:MAG: CoA ester lyase [Enhygromyxa sp.]